MTPLDDRNAATLSGRLPVDWLLLALLGGAYLALFAVYFPPLPGIEDEAEFINQSLVWSSGHLTAEGAGYDRLAGFVPVGGRSVAWRNPGRPLVTIPFLWVAGTPGALASGAFIQLGGTAALAALLRRLGRSPLWAALFLFHPTFALYSRAVMADGLAALLVLLALWAGHGSRRVGFRVGLFLALATVCRYQLAVVIPPAALALWLTDRRGAGRGRAISALLTASGVGAGVVAYNWVLFGHPLGFTAQGYFAIGMVWRNLPRYAASLTLVWPGLVLGPFLSRRRAWGLVHATVWPLLALLLPYYWMDGGGSVVQDLVLGLRLFLPGVAALLVPYTVVANDLSARLGPAGRWLVIGGLAALTAPTAVLMQLHQSHLRQLAGVREEVRRVVPSGSYVVGTTTSAKLFAVPDHGRLAYRWASVGDPSSAASSPLSPPPDEAWFVVLLSKSAEPPEVPDALRQGYTLDAVPTSSPGLAVYRVDPRGGEK